MFDVIDVQKCRAAAIQRFDGLLAAIAKSGVNDATGGRMAAVTMEEAYGIARNSILESVRYDAALAPRYIAQFPEILTMELVGASISDSIEQALRRAVFGRIEADVRQAVAVQFNDYGVDDLTRAVSTGLAMFERYLTKDPFAPLRIKPEKVLAHLSSVMAEPGEVELKLLMGQISNLVSELRTRASDARHAARALKEANQYCGLLVSGELVWDTGAKASTGYALAC
ncbi:hypothetical protein GOB57_21655 [Sinorhizobium meliloti]|nr:hypothetical protein [Sinorhizobium meliloti]